VSCAYVPAVPAQVFASDTQDTHTIPMALLACASVRCDSLPFAPVAPAQVFGYYPQHTPIPGDVRVIDYLREFAPPSPRRGAEPVEEGGSVGSRPRKGEPKSP